MGDPSGGFGVQERLEVGAAARDQNCNPRLHSRIT